MDEYGGTFESDGQYNVKIVRFKFRMDRNM